MSEKRYELPEGWVWTKIRNLALVVTKGSTPTSYGFEYQEKGILFVKVENISHYSIQHGTITQFISKETHKFLRRSQLQGNDILFSIAGTIGRACIVKKEDLPANTNQALAIIRIPSPSVDKKYLLYYLNSRIVQNSARDGMRGVGIYNISLEDVKNINVALPPLNEQKRIVEKIESLLASLNETKQKLFKILLLLKKFRQSVLAKAFRGELTEDWRDKQANLEPASTLLERIREERKKLLGKKYKEFESLDTSELPEGWICIRIGDLASVVTKGSTPTSYGFEYQEKGILFVKVENISDYSIQHGTITQFISKETHKFLGRSQLQEDDILFSIAGTIGRVCILKKEDLPANTNQALAIIRIPSSSVDKNYLLYYLDSRVAQDFARGEMRGVGIYNISLEDVKNIDVALPPLAEQKQIVKKIQDLFAQADTIEKSVKIAQTHCEKLTQSILAKAFRGELVKQDPNDEPVEELLNKLSKGVPSRNVSKSSKLNRKR